MSRLRSRVAAGALLAGVSSVLAVGGLAAPVGAQAPTVTSICTVDRALNNLGGRLTDFPASQSFEYFVIVTTGDGRHTVGENLPITTDATGAASTITVPFSPLPFQIGFAAYRDTNLNNRWDPDTDDTIYQGSGTVNTCPQNVVLSPK